MENFFSVDFGSVWLSWIWFGLVGSSTFVRGWFGLLCFGFFECRILHSKDHGQTCTKIGTYITHTKKNRIIYSGAAQQKKTWKNCTNLNLGFRKMTLSPPSPYIFGPNLFANKFRFCYDPSLPNWADDPNSALFWGAVFPKDALAYTTGPCLPCTLARYTSLLAGVRKPDRK